MTLSKKQQYKRLEKYDDDKWEKLLEPIKDINLKRKVACIVFWDFYHDPNNPYKRSLYLRDLTRSFIVKEHEHLVTDNMLYKELLKVGYPAWRAKERSKSPKCHR